MATRSAVGIFFNNSIKAVYGHNDGDVKYVGRTLQEHYTDINKIAQLISNGDFSTLGKAVNPQGAHSFNQPEAGVTVFYGRDRKERNAQHKTFETRNAFVKSFTNAGAEYFYLYEGGEWYVGHNGTWTTLADALATVNAAVEA